MSNHASYVYILEQLFMEFHKHNTGKVHLSMIDCAMIILMIINDYTQFIHDHPLWNITLYDFIISWFGVGNFAGNVITFWGIKKYDNIIYIYRIVDIDNKKYVFLTCGVISKYHDIVCSQCFFENVTLDASCICGATLENIYVSTYSAYF